MSLALLSSLDPSPHAADGDALYEVVHGVRVELPEIGVKSSLVGGRLFSQLDRFVESQGLGLAAVETLVILDAETDLRRRPDVCFVSAGRWPLDRPIPDEGDWNVVPDLAVEVASPNDLLSDVLQKIDEYFAHGVQAVWLIDPESQKAYVYRSPTDVSIRDGGQSLDSADLLRGLSIPLKSLFRPPLTALS